VGEDARGKPPEDLSPHSLEHVAGAHAGKERPAALGQDCRDRFNHLGRLRVVADDRCSRRVSPIAARADGDVGEHRVAGAWTVIVGHLDGRGNRRCTRSAEDVADELDGLESRVLR
jgi:hypothetical protein